MPISVIRTRTRTGFYYPTYHRRILVFLPFYLADIDRCGDVAAFFPAP